MNGSSRSSDWKREPFWLDDIRDAEQNALPVTPLSGPATAETAIVGGGFLGLWTAILIKQRDPSNQVTILEATTCGEGASGRNGGMALSWWPKIETLIERFGTEEAYRLARLSAETVADIGRQCDQLGVDAEFRAGGWLWTSTSPAQDGAWRHCVELASARGDNPLVELSRDEIRKRTGSDIHRGGAFEAGAATVHPGKLVRGLRRAALELGVVIHEHCPVTTIDNRMLELHTPAGVVKAEQIILANNAWAAEQNGFGRSIVPLSSDVIATAPIPELLSEIGWTDGESISNSRLMVDYYRTTESGRIVFGRGGGALTWKGRITDTFAYDEARARATLDSLQRLIPRLKDVEITHAWSGAVDRSRDGLPFVGAAGSTGRVHYGLGFSGNGVSASLFLAKALTAKVLGEKDEFSTSALCGGPRQPFPPEPFRYLGGQLVRQAVHRKEERENEGRPVGALNRRVASLAPSGFFKPSPSSGTD